MHQNSICFGGDKYHSPYMTFFTSQQTTKLFAYDCTEVTPWSVLLFGEEPVYEETESTRHLVVGGWSKFKVPGDNVLRIVLAMRKAFADIFAKKLGDLKWDHTESRELAVIKRVLLDQGLGFELRP